MDMEKTLPRHPVFSAEQVLAALGKVFYEVVPLRYQTYCVLTSRTVQTTLQFFGIDAKVIACQVWHAGADKNYVLGFHETISPRQWNGHAICMAQGWLIDAALHHFRKEFGLNVPNIVVKKSFDVTSNVISRLDLGPQERIWWHQPPHSLNVAIPEEPADMIADLSSRLIARIQAELEEKAGV
jgi:hypothetical protein